MLIALIIVLVTRWRRRKRHAAAAQAGTCGDPTDFAPFDADICSADFGSDKLSCGGDHPLDSSNAFIPGYHRRGGSSGGGVGGQAQHGSPRTPPLPRRPISYTPSAADIVNNTLSAVGPNFNSIRRTNDYDSNAEDLENAGCRDPIVIPDFMRNPGSPLVPVKRTLPLPPGAGNDASSSNVPNNLNKAENYRKSEYSLEIYLSCSFFADLVAFFISFKLPGEIIFYHKFVRTWSSDELFLSSQGKIPK